MEIVFVRSIGESKFTFDGECGSIRTLPHDIVQYIDRIDRCIEIERGILFVSTINRKSYKQQEVNMERYEKGVVLLSLFAVGFFFFSTGCQLLSEGLLFQEGTERQLVLGIGFSTGGILLIVCQLACREVLSVAMMIPRLWFGIVQRSFSGLFHR